MEQFKRTQVVMLPTNKDSKLVFNPVTNQLLNISNSPYSIQEWINIYPNIKPQHLYIISDDEIKIGDWFYNYFKKTIQRLKSNPEKVNNLKNCKKIIATTDTSLTYSFNQMSTDMKTYILPKPSQQFITKYIEEYNKGNIITDVLVEYEYEFVGDNISRDTTLGKSIKLKVNPKDNTITIKKLKNSWNREEVITLLSDLHLNYIGGKSQQGLKQWIKDNL